MTSERTKAVLFMVLTFIVGIVIGVFIPGIVMRGRFSDNNRNDGPDMRNMPPPQDRFERMLYRIVDPDSLQVEKIKPLARQTSARIDTIQSNANKQIKGVIDSLKTNLQPILKAEQLKKLEDFGSRPRSFGPGRPGGPGGEPGPDAPRNDERRGERPVGSAI